MTPPEYEDIDDDPDELDNQQLESSDVQRAMLPLYAIILIVGIMVGSVPFMLMYTFVRMVVYYSSGP